MRNILIGVLLGAPATAGVAWLRRELTHMQLKAYARGLREGAEIARSVRLS